MFDSFFGNGATVSSLERMIEQSRIPQTLLFEGPEGVGKATLARRFATRLLGEAHRNLIERDDLSHESNRVIIEEREKLPSDKRADDPLVFATYPDFVTISPEGPLRNLSIQQMRLLRERSQFRPLEGQWRVFLIDQMDRASQQASDSLLKTLEEPPDHLILIVTAENPYDLPATIRSRSVAFHLSPVSPDEMTAFCHQRGLSPGDRRVSLAGGCPGMAVTIDMEAYDRRRAVLLSMMEAGAGLATFGQWVQSSESYLAKKTEKLDQSIRLLYGLLEDIVILQAGGKTIRNIDLQERLSKVAARVSLDWIHSAVQQADDLTSLQRRNVQKGLTMDSFVVNQQRL